MAAAAAAAGSGTPYAREGSSDPEQWYGTRWDDAAPRFTYNHVRAAAGTGDHEMRGPACQCQTRELTGSARAAVRSPIDSEFTRIVPRGGTASAARAASEPETRDRGGEAPSLEMGNPIFCPHIPTGDTGFPFLDWRAPRLAVSRRHHGHRIPGLIM